MISRLKKLVEDEKGALEGLLKILESQHKYIIEEDVFMLEDVAKDIEEANKKIALLEIERRNLTGTESMSEVVKKYDDKELNLLYRDIKIVLNELSIQKETNEILIKQGLGFTTQMLNLVNPKGCTPKTYNSYGKVKR